MMHMKETQEFLYLSSYIERAFRTWQPGYQVRENRHVNFWYLLSTKYYLFLSTLEKSGFQGYKTEGQTPFVIISIWKALGWQYEPLYLIPDSHCVIFHPYLPGNPLWSPDHELARTGRLDWSQLSLSLDAVGPHENTWRHWCGAWQTSQSEKGFGNSLLACFSSCSLNMSCKERGLRSVEQGLRIGHSDPYNTCPGKSWLSTLFNRKADNLAQWTLICAYT